MARNGNCCCCHASILFSQTLQNYTSRKRARGMEEETESKTEWCATSLGKRSVKQGLSSFSAVHCSATNKHINTYVCTYTHIHTYLSKVWHVPMLRKYIYFNFYFQLYKLVVNYSTKRRRTVK